MSAFDSVLKVVRGIVKLRGGTDNTVIGNVGDKIKVDAEINTENDGSIPTIGKGIRYKDLNATHGGVAREAVVGAAFEDLYNEAGAGVLLGFILTLESVEAWDVKILIDAVDVTDGGIAISDMNDSDIYHLNGDFNLTQPAGLNIWTRNTQFIWNAPGFFPIRFDSRVQIQGQNPSGKKFKGGLIALTGV